MSARCRVGIDIGGTFTDAVLVSETDGAAYIAKVPSTPADPAAAFLTAFERVLKKAGIEPPDVGSVVHGTTVATNALIEGKTPRTAFVTTRGFGDMLEIARQVRPSLYDVHFEKPRPLVPRNLCFEVRERLDASGKVLEALDENEVKAIALEMERQGVVSVAVCFLHAYQNPDHEEQALALLTRANPQISVSLSSRVLPEFREYFRASTTVVNACLAPVVASYLGGVENRLRERGTEAELLAMQSNGGVLTFAAAAEKPVYLVESGPAAGVIAASFIAGSLGYRNLLSLDMGGTTTKAGLILDGQPKVTKEYEVGAKAMPAVGQNRGNGYPIRVPVLDLVEIGAGGGSIAWTDSGGVLRVGPASAGADPGPVCYDRGGSNPTLTDANLVLGRLNPEFFLGGEMPLNRAAAEEAIRARCAEPLGMSPTDAALGIVEIANAAMINALRLVSIRRGFDPRDFVLVAFGGAAPLHVNRLAVEMQIPLVIVPPSPGTTSALGLLATDLKHVFSHTRILCADRLPAGELTRIFAPLERQGRDTLLHEGFRPEQIRILREMEMRYAGQSHELPVSLAEDWPSDTLVQRAVESFHQEHQRSYGHSYPEQPVEAVTFRVTALGVIAKPRLRELQNGSSDVAAAQKSTRPVFFAETGGFSETPVYDRYRLAAAQRFRGPAVVEELDSTSLIHPGFEVEVDRYGSLLIRPQ